MRRQFPRPSLGGGLDDPGDLRQQGEPMAVTVQTVFVADGTLLGARLSPALASAVLYYLREQQASVALEELRRFAALVELEGDQMPAMLRFPWDLIGHCGEQIVRDLPLFSARLPNVQGDDPQLVTRGRHVYIAESARLDGPIVLDARDGPVIIDEGAQIEPFSFIQGPAYIGPNSLIASARIRGETSIGPTCRIGGEVEASIVQGFSNKHHDGFLGHSWLGEWVNIGAMTTNSDLKNNYGSVRIVLEGLGQLDSGVLKLGCFLADHVKLGIGLHLNGGTVIGTGSNIFGIHSAPKTIPPFTWGGDVFREYRIESMIDVARKVMARRKRSLSPEYEALLRAVLVSRAPVVAIGSIHASRRARRNNAGVRPRSQPCATSPSARPCSQKRSPAAGGSM
ncbi:hypothetical protein HC891_27180 [Candidatus Gracilibacteria bacterium]|nr:hypothetical protein [Candidatus Gracilibacteria bacterium]